MGKDIKIKNLLKIVKKRNVYRNYFNNYKLFLLNKLFTNKKVNYHSTQQNQIREPVGYKEFN
jgi:hypothetical protein